MKEDTLKIAACFKVIGSEFKKSMMSVKDAQYDCSMKEYKILEFLHEDKKTMSELSAELGLTPGSMTAAIDNAIEKNLVKREHDKDDRRKVYISLTAKGKKITDFLLAKHIEISEKMLSFLSKKEQKEFTAMLEKISEGFKN